MSNTLWVCSTNSTHTFSRAEAEKEGYFCPKCEYGESVLVAGGTGGGPESTTPGESLGLCIMLLDCSGSMNEPAFQNHPLSKKDLIAKSVAAGIFSLKGNVQRKYAYILIIGFDHNVDTLLPYTSIEQIVQDYKTPEDLEQALRVKMYKKEGTTDINSALEVAFRFTQQFINSDISALGIYKPSIQAVFDDKMESHQIPNVRVLLFTDGIHFIDENNMTLNPSPFKELQYDGKVFDLLMGAYYGNVGEPGYRQLLSLVSKCPKHTSTDQFFLFDDPKKVANLRGLFRMASGASGFCPKCLEEANISVSK